MAQGLSTKLGPLLYASNQTPERNFALARMADMAPPPSPMMKGRALKPLAISPDRITRSATVYAVFAIE
jgi:hypothetical protein